LLLCMEEGRGGSSFYGGGNGDLCLAADLGMQEEERGGIDRLLGMPKRGGASRSFNFMKPVQILIEKRRVTTGEERGERTPTIVAD